jgi:uncharacterized protein
VTPPAAAPPARSLLRRVRPFVVILLVVEVVLPALLVLGRNRLLFFPFSTPVPEAALHEFRDVPCCIVVVRRPDGRQLAAYDVTPPGAAPDGPVVLFLHGNAGNIATRARLAAWFAATTRCRVLMASYSGYGGNAGAPSEETLCEDGLAAYDHLVAQGVDARRIVVFGESIGSTPALFVATSRKVAGVVVQSGPSSLSSMALRVYPWLPLASLLVVGKFPNAERVARVEAPVLIVHGRRDTVVPFAEGERLRDAAPPGTELLAVDGADHNDLFDVAGDAYLRDLGDRFRRWVAR